MKVEMDQGSLFLGAVGTCGSLFVLSEQAIHPTYSISRGNALQSPRPGWKLCSLNMTNTAVKEAVNFARRTRLSDINREDPAY